ncbi:MAG: GNAT family N-acetyltransferase [Chloroflexi bacterium]|nr:GNAT family N-acetyltransferase [Chloroflexota bacterium]
MGELIIRDYRPEDKEEWLRLRVVSFLHTAYYDDVYDDRIPRDNPLIDLVAELDGELVGLLETEIDPDPESIFEHPPGLCGIVWNLAVHPDHRRKGIGGKLLSELENRARQAGITYLEAWTRDDEDVLRWYGGMGFEIKYVYLHVYLENEEHKGILKSCVKGLTPVKSFCHGIGVSASKLVKKHRVKRIHACNGMMKILA